MACFFPEGFYWSKPDGGRFVWVEGPAGMDMEAVNLKAISRHTAFVPGRFFFADPEGGQACLRLNYTMADERTIFKAAQILGEVFDEALTHPSGSRKAG